MTYNGWSNYETWCCFTWLTNDINTYLYIMEIIKPIPVYEAEEWLRLYIKNNTAVVSGLYGDLLTSAIDNIIFIEVVRGLKGE